MIMINHFIAKPRSRASLLRKMVVGLSVASCALSVLISIAHADSYTAEVIMSNLNNPRGLAIRPDGSIYVAEAGSGGNGPSVVGIAGENVSYGATGGISRWKAGEGQSQVFFGLPSLAEQDPPQGLPGSSATGLHDIVFVGNEAYGVIGSPGAVNERNTLNSNGAPGQNVGDLFGRLVQLTSSGVFTTPTTLADFVPYETANNLDVGDVNSNPIGLMATSTGFAVVDAGANVLYGVNGGVITPTAIFGRKPNPLFPDFGPPTYAAVPTAVAMGPNDTMFVSELTGFPFPAGGADIYTVKVGEGITGIVPNTGPGTTSGFTTLIDLAYGNGSLYALSYASNFFSPVGGGQVWQIDPVTGARTLLYSGLTTPGGLALGDDGALYVSNLGTSPGTGEVLRLTVTVPEAGSGLLALAVAPITAGLAIFARRRRVS